CAVWDDGLSGYIF
nr:immunoglobulin light chain junction region [Macaca mulatta]MPO03927.1 immunoglobulin light chain junction region [Macaca mulatta]MPO04168.1 immunoglobulin light chain junction region [Macaca mulatta]MPO04605.1 immunoglobulin light chain junction region [Macaca mulatta]MPO05912.1 immunoglobulin light chain junction region [Macaca mulatta]